MISINDYLKQQEEQSQRTILYLCKEKLDSIFEGVNVLKAFEVNFKRNKQGLIIIDLTKQVNIPNSSEGLILSNFLNGVLFLQYKYLIID